jgi:alkylhydroperoxidase family enzyme
VKRLDYLGEFFQCTAHQPEALLSFLEFTENLKHALPVNLTEIIALSVAVLMENDYERVQHERLSLKLGFDAEWLREVLSVAVGGRKLLTEQEWLVQQLALAVAKRGGRNTTAEFEAVIHAIGSALAIAALMLIGRYMAHALIVNTLDLSPPAVALAEENAA